MRRAGNDRLLPLLAYEAPKRILDIVVATVGLLVLALPIAAIVAAIWATDPRAPVLFRQRRTGRHGHRFVLLKFRTMVANADAVKERYRHLSTVPWPDFRVENDPRVTRVGRVLRRTSLDELPQLVNVLRGEMSLVGPRPERPAYIESFRHAVPGYMLRHKVRAGMTGWAQVHGWRGDTSIQERLEHDLYYIQKWSFWLDLRILAMTLLRLGRPARAPLDVEPDSEDRGVADPLA